MPSPVRRDGCASKKMPRSNRSGADGVVAHNASFGMHSRNVTCERPPRPLQIKWLRSIFLDVASTPYEEANITYPNQFVHTFLRWLPTRAPQKSWRDKSKPINRVFGMSPEGSPTSVARVPARCDTSVLGPFEKPRVKAWRRTRF